MRSRFQLPSVVLITTLWLTTPVASAGTYVFNLPVPQQTLTYGDPRLTVPFSAGMEFSSIQSMEIEVVGTSDYGVERVERGDVIVEKSFPPPLIIGLSREIGWDLDFWPFFNENSSGSRWRFAHVEIAPTVELGLPSPGNYPSSFTDFLDGEGFISFEHGSLRPIDIVTPSIIHLKSARVTIYGQAVPEPGSEVLVVSALFVAGCWVRGRGRVF
jgi:hypothetical protein